MNISLEGFTFGIRQKLFEIAVDLGCCVNSEALIVVSDRNAHGKQVVSPRWLYKSEAAGRLLPLERFRLKVFAGLSFLLVVQDLEVRIRKNGGSVVNKKADFVVSTRKLYYVCMAIYPESTVVTDDWIIECIDRKTIEVPMGEVNEVTYALTKDIFYLDFQDKSEEDKLRNVIMGCGGICLKKRLGIVTKVITDKKNSQGISREEFALFIKKLTENLF